MPRPPETTIFASVNSGRPPLTGGCDEEIAESFAASLISALAFSTAGDALVKSASMLFGRTVIIGVPFETFECTVVDPPNTN